MKIPIQNRRAFRRRDPSPSVRVECRPMPFLARNVCVQCLDISETGIRLVIKKELRPNDEVEVLITGGGLTVSVKRIAKVQWVTPAENGLFCVGLFFQKSLPYRHFQAVTSAFKMN